MVKKKQTPKTTRAKITHHAKRVFVPHKGNQFRPHLIRWQGLSVVLALALILQTTYGLVTTGKFQVLGQASNISVSELVADTNAERAKQGREYLSLNTELNEAAYAKAQDMFANDYWAHTSPNGTTPWKWLADEKYNYNSAGENLAKNYPDAQATVDAWMASPSHRENMLKANYKEVGFAVVDGTLNDKPTTLVVAYYGEPLGGNIAANAPITLTSAVNAGGDNPLAYFGSTIQALNPATITILALFALVALTAGVAHHYRKRLPKPWRASWKIHHGAFTLVGVLIVMMLVLVGTGGGQI